MIIERIDKDQYQVDGVIFDGKVQLWNLLRIKANGELRYKQVGFLVDQHTVSRSMLRLIPDLRYVDNYTGITTRYPREVEMIKPHTPIVSAASASIRVQFYSTASDHRAEIKYILNDDQTLSSTSELSLALEVLGIYLTAGQIRFIMSHGLNEELKAKYPRLSITQERIKFEQDRRSAVQVDESSTSHRECLIQRVGIDQYRYNGQVMINEDVRKRLQEDGFIINKNVISLIFGQGKIPKSVADRYPNLKYEDLR